MWESLKQSRSSEILLKNPSCAILLNLQSILAVLTPFLHACAMFNDADGSLLWHLMLMLLRKLNWKHAQMSCPAKSSKDRIALHLLGQHAETSLKALYSPEVQGYVSCAEDELDLFTRRAVAIAAAPFALVTPTILPIGASALAPVLRPEALKLRCNRNCLCLANKTS